MPIEQALGAANRMHLQPVLIGQSDIPAMVSAIQSLAVADRDKEAVSTAARMEEMIDMYGMRARASLNEKPFLYVDGLAIIPIHGVLVNRFGYSWGYVTGYNFIRRQMDLAVADDDVKGIIFDVNTYGGEAAGCFELAEEIALIEKPTLAMVDSAAYSGGMALISGCDTICVIPSGGVGSIGVICTHWNYKSLLEKNGVEVTMIFSGEHKADANPFEKLEPSVKADLQSRVNKTRKAFATLVANNRGKDVQDIMATEAQTYRAEDALALGLIDTVATPVKAVSVFLTELTGSTTTEEISMSTTANASAAQPGTGQEAAPGNQVNAAEIRKSERERMSAILTCEEAKGRTTLANHLATKTEMSLADAQAALSSSPLETASTEKPKGTVIPGQEANNLQTAMDADGGAGVEADASGDKTNKGTAELTMAQQILRDQALATGVKLN